MMNDVRKAGSPGGRDRAVKRVFIDGQAGTVGLCIRERLSRIPGISVVEISPELRKDVGARLECLRQADVAVLCLPDAAAVATIALLSRLGSEAPKILDASTAHRVTSGWAYGFPEMAPNQEDAIASATLVSNPGCYAIGAIGLLRPLLDANIIPPDFPISINGVSGYSGGGNAMIGEMESGKGPVFKLYGLDFNHKHLPEVQKFSGLRRRPVFVPSVGNFRQGMLVSVPLHLDTLPGRPAGGDLVEVYRQHYAEAERISVVPVMGDGRGAELEPEALNETDKLEIRAYSGDDYGQVVLVARLDNLGMGAAGTAVRNIELMLQGEGERDL